MNTELTRSASDRRLSRARAVGLAVLWLFCLLLPAMQVSADTSASVQPATHSTTNLTIGPGSSLAAESSTSSTPHDLQLEVTPARHSTLSAQDLSLFGILALGIIGLLWVRRHTSEL